MERKVRVAKTAKLNGDLHFLGPKRAWVIRIEFQRLLRAVGGPTLKFRTCCHVSADIFVGCVCN